MKRYPSVILGTCVVPWDEAFRFDEARFRAQVRGIVKDLTPHLYVFGTAGEGYAVTESQFDQIAQVFFDEMQRCGAGETGGMAADAAGPMIGVISLSLGTVIERIERARDMGYRRFQISLPAWGECSDVEVDRFFDATCGRFGDCVFLHYNLMRTKRLLTGDDYARLSARHDNLVAVKTGGKHEALIDMLTKAPALQYFVPDPTYPALRDAHEVGLLISLAGTNPQRAKAMFDARGDALAQYGVEIKQMIDALFAAVDGRGHMDGVFDKMLYKVHDRDFPLRLLPPYSHAGDDAFDRFLDTMPKAWLPE